MTIASPHVPGSPHYRLMLRNGAVRAALEQFRPDLIECQDAYNLPWAAIAHRKRYPETALVAAYMTDFPTVYVERPFSKFLGRPGRPACAPHLLFLLRRALPPLRCDLRAQRKRRRGQAADARHRPCRRRAARGRGRRVRARPARPAPAAPSSASSDGQPLLIYVGRLDGEKKPDVVVDAFRRLPASLGAKLALIGEGPLQDDIAALGDEPHHHAGLCEGPRRAGALAGERRHLCLGHGRRDFRGFDHRGAGLRPSGRRRRGRRDDRPGDRGDRAARPGRRRRRRWRANILDVWNGDRHAMARGGASPCAQFSWDSSMERCSAAFTRPRYPRGRASGSRMRHASPGGRRRRRRRRATPMDAPYAKLEQLEPGIARVLAHNPSAFTYYGTQTYLIGDERGRGDRSRARPARASRRAGAGDRRTPGRGDHVHPHPPRPQPGGAAAGRARPARRSSAARRSRWRRSARAPTPRSTATMRPTACSTTAKRSRSTAKPSTAVATPGHTSNHLCFAYGGALVHRRPCDGLVDDRRRSARRRHGRLYARASTSCGSATTASIIRRTGRR